MTARYTWLERNALTDPDLKVAQIEAPLRLDCGQELSGYRLAYKTYGSLNQDKSNVVLIFHALSGDSHVSGSRRLSDKQISGWWSEGVGPGKPIDTNKYFVVCSNVIGGCAGSTGPSSFQRDGTRHGLEFPPLTIGDMASAQVELLSNLGLQSVHAVVGGSMGGMLALEFVRLAKRRISVGKAVIIAVGSHSTPQQTAFHYVERNSIVSDPSWMNGQYSDNEKDGPNLGLGLARMIAHTTYCGAENLSERFDSHSTLTVYSPQSVAEKPIEKYLDAQAEKFIKRFDANSFIYLTKAMDNFDIRGGDGGISKQFSSVGVDFLIVSLASDWLYPVSLSEDLTLGLRKLGNHAIHFHAEETVYGHDAFVIEPHHLSKNLREFLEL